MKFKLNESFTIDSDVEPFKRTGIRIGIYGDPGSTKSYTTAACFIEPFLEQGGTIVIFEPRAEWHTLKEKFPDVQVVGGAHLQDIPFTASHPKLYADAVVQSGISLIFYTPDAPNIDKLIDFVASFLDHIMKNLEKHKRPILVLLEEANRYAPLNKKDHPEGAAPWVLGRMIGRILEMYRDARKLGMLPISITQRPQDLNFALRQLCNLTLLGMFSSQDVKYLDKEILTPMRKNLNVNITAQDLVKLQAGQWIVVTRGESTKEKLTIKRKTPHGADTPELKFIPEASQSVKAKASDLARQLKELLEKEGIEESEVEQLKRKVKSLEDDKSELKRKVELGLDLKELLHGSPAKISENVEKRIIELETQLQEQMQSHTTLQRDYTELQTRNHQLESDLEAVKPFIDLIQHLVEAKIEEKYPSKATASTEDRTPRANIQLWIDNPHIPEPARRILDVFSKSPRGAIYTRSQLAVECKYSPTSSSINSGVSYLAKNGLVNETSAGVKLNGE